MEIEENEEITINDWIFESLDLQNMIFVWHCFLETRTRIDLSFWEICFCHVVTSKVHRVVRYVMFVGYTGNIQYKTVGSILLRTDHHMLEKSDSRSDRCFHLQKLKKMTLHPWKLTWNLQITSLKRKIFQTFIFRFHVNCAGGIFCRFRTSTTHPSLSDLDIDHLRRYQGILLFAHSIVGRRSQPESCTRQCCFIYYGIKGKKFWASNKSHLIAIWLIKVKKNGIFMSVQEYVSAFFAVSPKTWGVSPVSRRHPGDWHVDLYLGIPCRTSVWNRHNRRELPDNPRRSVKCSKICHCIKTNKSINYRCLNDVFQPKMFKSSKIEKKNTQTSQTLHLSPPNIDRITNSQILSLEFFRSFKTQREAGRLG